MSENKRMRRQVEIDATKSSIARNREGQFATPFPLAVEIVKFVARLIPKKKPIKFLEPCVGSGAFYSACCEVLPSIKKAVGYEKDPAFATAARELWESNGLEVIQGDFTRQMPTPSFNLVLTNPPYVRHHHLSSDDKVRLREASFKATGLTLSGLSGLYCHFLLQVDVWLEEGAISAWLIPSEFMDVNYGKALRDYLTDSVKLIHIHQFCPTDGQFADAMVSSAVVVFEKGKPSKTAMFSFGGSLLKPERETIIPIPTLKKAAKWTRLNDPKREQAARKDGDPTLGDLFTVKRGLATGSNDFFIITKWKAKELGLPAQFLKPILPSPRALSNDVVEGNGDLVLLDCPLAWYEVENNFPKLASYLKTGIAEKLHEGYLVSRRTPWYSQENRPAAPFLCTYMGRSRNGKKPFRFIWNQSSATAHNVYLLLYPKGILKTAIDGDPSVAGKVYEALSSLDTDSFKGEGRVYGGGLFKMEPKELGNLPAKFLLDAIRLHLPKQSSLFEVV